MSRSPEMQARDGHRFPRVSGDEPPAGRVLIEMLTFSPRERG